MHPTLDRSLKFGRINQELQRAKQDALRTREVMHVMCALHVCVHGCRRLSVCALLFARACVFVRAYANLYGLQVCETASVFALVCVRAHISACPQEPLSSAVLDISAGDLQEIVAELSNLPPEGQEVSLGSVSPPPASRSRVLSRP